MGRISTSHSLLAIVEVILGITLAYVCSVFIYAFLLSPVRHIPGPWWARVSRIPLQRAVYRRQRAAYATDLLKRYGSTVVIAPDQVHTNHTEAMKIIYNKNSIKTSFYKGQGTYKGGNNLLGHLEYSSAARGRTNLMQCFQSRNLATLTETMSSHVFEFIDILKKKCGGDVELVYPMQLCAMDVVADIAWGEKESLLAQYESTSVPLLLRRVGANAAYGSVAAFIPGFATYVRYFGSAKWKKIYNDYLELDKPAEEALSRWEQRKERRDRDVLSMIMSMEGTDAHKSEQFRKDLYAQMIEVLAAGSHTTEFTAVQICWYLAHHPDVQGALHDELKKIMPDNGSLDLRKTIDLALLDAVIKETMRLVPAAPGPLERILREPLKINGYELPPGVVVSTGTFDQGRITSAFPEPNRWDPSRWDKDNVTESMAQNFIPFGYGSRRCPGENLAMTELRYIIGAMFRTFRVSPPETKMDSNETVDIFLSIVKAKELWLRFDLLEE